MTQPNRACLGWNEFVLIPHSRGKQFKVQVRLLLKSSASGHKVDMLLASIPRAYLQWKERDFIPTPGPKSNSKGSLCKEDRTFRISYLLLSLIF